MQRRLIGAVAFAAILAPCAQAQVEISTAQVGGAAGLGSGFASTTNSTFFPSRTADNIVVSTGGDVTTVRWWGQMLDAALFIGVGDVTGAASFSVEIFNMDGTDVGASVASAQVSLSSIVTSVDGVSGIDGSDIFKYEATLPSTITLAPGNYAVSVAADVADPQDSVVFSWQRTLGPDDGVFHDIGSGWALFAGAGVGDMAVVLLGGSGGPPPGSPGAIEAELRTLADATLALPNASFDAPSQGALNGRRRAMSNMLTAAANLAADGDYAGAIAQLTSVLAKVDGDPAPPDWVTGADGAQMELDVSELIAALLLL